MRQNRRMQKMFEHFGEHCNLLTFWFFANATFILFAAEYLYANEFRRPFLLLLYSSALLLHSEQMQNAKTRVDRSSAQSDIEKVGILSCFSRQHISISVFLLPLNFSRDIRG